MLSFCSFIVAIRTSDTWLSRNCIHYVRCSAKEEHRVELELRTRTELKGQTRYSPCMLVLTVIGNRPLSKTKEASACHHC